MLSSLRTPRTPKRRTKGCLLSTLLFACHPAVCRAEPAAAGAHFRDFDADYDCEEFQGPRKPRISAAESEARCPEPSLAVLVHGINPVKSDFDPLELELRRRGSEVRRFRYDDSQSLEVSSDEFAGFIRSLVRRIRPQRLTVFAHSMGGLVSRRAMTMGRRSTLADSSSGAIPITLVTIASPFGGAYRGRIPIPWNILGIKESHRFLGTASSFIRDPGRLGNNIVHFKVETDERDGKESRNGRTVSDFVFRLKNQRRSAVDSDPRLVRREVVGAGHVGVLQHRGSLSPPLRALVEALFPPIAGSSGFPCTARGEIFRASMADDQGSIRAVEAIRSRNLASWAVARPKEKS